jgi:hypothetical protein
MDCLRFEQLVQRYWDDDLGPVHTRLMRQHAASCTGCGATLEDYGTLFALLGDLEREPAPAGLEAAVLARLDLQAHRPSLRERVLRWLVRPEDLLPGPAQMGVATTLVLAALTLGGGWIESLGRHLLIGVGDAATWTYVHVTGIVAGAAAGFLTETWPALRQTLGTLTGALRLLREAHGIEVGATFGLVLLLVVVAAMASRPRQGRGASTP